MTNYGILVNVIRFVIYFWGIAVIKTILFFQILFDCLTDPLLFQILFDCLTDPLLQPSVLTTLVLLSDDVTTLIGQLPTLLKILSDSEDMPSLASISILLQRLSGIGGARWRMKQTVPLFRRLVTECPGLVRTNLKSVLLNIDCAGQIPVGC